METNTKHDNIININEIKQQEDSEVDLCNNLIDELSNNRNQMKDMLNTISSFRKRINEFLPEPAPEDKMNFRDKKYNKYLMTESMKTVTEILKTELDVRKTLEASIKNEIELRRKVNEDEFIQRKEKDIDNEFLTRMIKEINKKKKNS